MKLEDIAPEELEAGIAEVKRLAAEWQAEYDEELEERS